MRAAAPGKLVVSGAYSVLEGAPAIVTAVDRYVVADTGRPAEFLAPEVRAAIGDRPPPWYDATALRSGDGKIGLGSSAAIVVSSLGALALDDGTPSDDEALRDAVFHTALRAHREAQGGGSGIDVAASAYGGTLVAVLGDHGLRIRPVGLPSGVVVEVWASGNPASTSELVRRVRALGARSPEAYRDHITALSRAATATVAAVDEGDASRFVAGLRDQLGGFVVLGRDAGVPIVTEAVAQLARSAQRTNAVVLPAGAGGGDVALFVGTTEPDAELIAERDRLGHRRVALALGARGLHAAGR